MYTLKKGTEITKEILLDVIKYNEGRKARFDNLEKYYFGQHEIMERVKNDTEINNKIVVNHAKYIVDTNTGYLLGNPVEYQVNDTTIDIEPILDVYKEQTINDLDSELSKDISIFGLQHEYLYANEDGDPRSANVDNRSAIIVYDTTLEHKKLFAVMYRPIIEGNRKTPSYYEVVCADKAQVWEYKLHMNTQGLEETEVRDHAFGDVPMIEYRNNSDYFGDFEPVITLINAYNTLQSDRLNDKEQLVDAILTFYGAEVSQVDMDMLRNQRVISGIPADAKVEYLTKSLNEADADTLRQTIEADIHKISMTPNMSDAEFVGNSSGVAIRYKLLSFEQNIKNKERYMERGLMERFKLYWNFLNAGSKVKGDVKMKEIDAVFKRNLPSNDLETSTIISNLDGKVDDETLVGQLSFVKDAKQVIEQARKEAEDRQAKLAEAMKATEIPDANDENDDEEIDVNNPTKKPKLPVTITPQPIKK